MTTKQGPPPPLRADMAVDKVDIKTRTTFSALLATKGPQSPLWLANQGISDSGAKLIKAGTDLGTADVEYEDALINVENKKGVRETRLGAWNGLYDLFVSNVEVNATKPEDLSSVALSVLTRNVYLLDVPLSIALKYDLKAHLIRIHVKLPKGLKTAEIEVSTDGTTFKRLIGTSVKRTIESPAPGTYWVRAAAVKGTQQSAFVDPVQIVVKP